MDQDIKINIEADDCFEQLQALMKALEVGSIVAGPYEPSTHIGRMGGPLIVEDLMWPPQEASCFHKWKSYIGFTDKYEYCETCGVKQ